MKKINSFLYNEFVFSSRYRVWRHLAYWTFHIAIWAAFWAIVAPFLSYPRYLLNMVMWVPCFIFFSYPLVYIVIPRFLLKGKLLQFVFITLGWAAAGIYLDVGYRSYILIPLQEAMKLDNILPRGPIPFCYLCMTTSAASPMIIKFFKLWKNKQQDWLQARREKVTAELELLKKQIHPHFLFNTLNNIYSFSLTNSPQTPGLILKLSSLLNYMLYDCKTEEVELEKEIEVMKNYVDLEKERYGNALELNWNVEGKIKNKKIAPLLMLPFLENAFKHGVSEQIERPRLSVNISIVNNVLQCTISNSKNTYIKQSHQGIGIDNVKKRLEFIYPSRYELAIRDEGSVFTVVMQLRLMNELSDYTIISAQPFMNQAVSA